MVQKSKEFFRCGRFTWGTRSNHLCRFIQSIVSTSYHIMYYISILHYIMYIIPYHLGHIVLYYITVYIYIFINLVSLVIFSIPYVAPPSPEDAPPDQPLFLCHKEGKHLHQEAWVSNPLDTAMHGLTYP